MEMCAFVLLYCGGLTPPPNGSAFFCGKQEELEAGSIMSSLIALQRQVGSCRGLQVGPGTWLALLSLC